MDFRHLLERLASALNLFVTPGEQDDGTPNDKAGVNECLDAVHLFLIEQGIDPSLLRPLRETTAALRDLNEGKEPALLTKRKAPGAPPRSTDRQALMATASVAVSRLMEAGDSEDAACQRVSKVLMNARLVIGNPRRETPYWTSMRDDREKVMSGRFGEASRDLYRNLMAFTDGMEPRGVAETLLRELPLLHQSEKAKTG
jgi:hypothetical protein